MTAADLEAGKELPTTVVIRADRAASFRMVNRVIKACQAERFSQFRPEGPQRGGLIRCKTVNVAFRSAKVATAFAERKATTPATCSFPKLKMRKRRRTRSQSEVELNLAAMLDMAFQLLTFFILTYRPPPTEGQISLRLPPPEGVTAQAGQKVGSDNKNKGIPEGLNTLTITVLADPRTGELTSLGIGEKGQTSISNVVELDSEIAQRPGQRAVRPGDHPSQPDVPLRRVDEGYRRMHAPDARQRQEALEAELRGLARRLTEELAHAVQAARSTTDQHVSRGRAALAVQRQFALVLLYVLISRWSGSQPHEAARGGRRQRTRRLHLRLGRMPRLPGTTPRRTKTGRPTWTPMKPRRPKKSFGRSATAL